jgi:hypothetical protein
LEITGHAIEKCETIVSGMDLRLAIRESLPRYGIQPALSGVLYAAEQGKRKPGLSCSFVSFLPWTDVMLTSFFFL